MKKLALLILLPLAAFAQDDELARRPLFAQSRRPDLAPAARLNSASMRLTGVVTEAGRRVALIHIEEQRGEQRVGPGASLNGWQVTAIDGRGLDLAAAGQQIRVTLKQPIPLAPE